MTTKNGRSYNVDEFSSRFRTWCDAAGLLQRCVFHGLRNAAARRGRLRGARDRCDHGHATLSKVTRHTKAADQAHLARLQLVTSSIAHGLPGEFHDLDQHGFARIDQLVQSDP